MLSAEMSAEHSTRLWLASASPRRRELLARLGLPFEVAAADLDESLLPAELPEAAVCRLAVAKAEAVSRLHPGALVLGADTLVALGSRCFGKPRDPAEARDMLAALAGRTHQVWTAVALARLATPTACQSAVAQVTFRALSAAEIAAYVATREPLDKAGAYAIQGGAGAFVERLEGDQTTVVGLPLPLTRALLSAAGALPP